jgi:hypothetical protein
MNALPGQDVVERGVEDLRHRRITAEALLVSIGAPRLRRLGIDVPEGLREPERALYDLLTETSGDAAHSRYNALVRLLVSYERAAECGGL